MSKSKKVLFLGLLVAMLILLYPPPSCHAQGAKNEEHRAQAYLFFSPGVATGNGNSAAIFHSGGGAEGLFYKGLGAGAEIGYLAPFRDTGDGFGVASFNGVYKFSRTQKVVPFVTGGYSLLFRSGSANAANFGAGFDYWLKDHLGIRLEFRDYQQVSTNVNYATFRIGLSF